MDKQLAKITSAKLEIQERQSLNFWIFVDYEEGCSQGIGGICLDNYDQLSKQRIGTAYGCEMIRQLLLTLNVNDFSEMKGKHIWVYGEGSNFNFKPLGISGLQTDSKDQIKPLIFSEIYEMFKE